MGTHAVGTVYFMHFTDTYVYEDARTQCNLREPGSNLAKWRNQNEWDWINSKSGKFRKVITFQKILLRSVKCAGNMLWTGIVNPLEKSCNGSYSCHGPKALFWSDGEEVSATALDIPNSVVGKNKVG